MAIVIADIAGQYETLLALLKKTPQGEEIVSIGDLVDRGPKSKEALNFFMEKDSNRSAIMGNHEHMMWAAYRKPFFYQRHIWEYNGGTATQKQINFMNGEGDQYLDWVDSLPLFLERDQCLISHAFLPAETSLLEACKNAKEYSTIDNSILWNRDYPVRKKEWNVQIAGHNSQMGYRRFSDDAGEYAICIDASSEKVLTAIDTKTLKVYQQQYIG